MDNSNLYASKCSALKDELAEIVARFPQADLPFEDFYRHASQLHEELLQKTDVATITLRHRHNIDELQELFLIYADSVKALLLAVNLKAFSSFSHFGSR